MLRGVWIFSAPVVDLGEAADRCEVLGGRAQHVLELMPRLLEAAKLQQRTAEGYARREVGGVALQAGLTGGDGIIETSRTPVFLGQRGERD